jgi:RNA polymerase sigma-70 factor (ECF subfamily)
MIAVTHTDRETARRLAEGDEGALEELLERYWQPACRLGARLTGDEGLGADVAQESFVRLLQHAQRFDAERAFKPWVFQIVRNVATDQRRSHSRRLARERSVARRERQEAPELGDQEALTLALAQLPEDLRQALTLKYLGELTYAELADVLDCPEGTATSRVRRGLESLRAALGAERAAAMVPLPALLALLEGAPAAPTARALLALAAQPLKRSRGVVLVVAAALLAATVAVAISASARRGAGELAALPPSASQAPARRPLPSASTPSETEPRESAAAQEASAVDASTTHGGSPPVADDASPPDAGGVDTTSEPTGKVLLFDGQTGQRMTHTEIELTLWHAGPDGERVESRRRARTNAQGRCDVALPEGAYGVRGRVGDRFTQRRTLYVESEHRVAKLELAAPGSDVTVRVVDELGHAVAGATVELLAADPSRINAPFGLYGQSGSVWLPAANPSRPVTGADGTLRVPGTPPGSYLVLARAEGRIGRLQPVTVERAGALLEVEVVLDEVCPTASVRLRVRVEDPSLLQQDYAHVTMEPGGILLGASVREEEVLEELPSGVELELGFLADGHGQVQRRLTLSPGEERLLEVLLPVQAPIVGQVLLPDGTPAPGGSLVVNDGFFHAEIESDGRFSIRELPAGPVTLVAKVPGWLSVPFSGLDPRVEHTLRLPQEPTMELRIRDQEGNPVQAYINSQGRSADTDAEGRVRLSGEVGARISCFVSPRGGNRQTLERAFVPGGVVTVIVDEGGELLSLVRRVAGRVVDASGAPLAGVRVSASDDDPLTTDASGAFAFDDLPAGRLEVQAYRADLAPGVLVLELPRDGVQEGLLLRLEPGSPVTALLRGPRAGQVTWLTVSRAGDDRPTHELGVERTRALDLGQLGAGSWEVTATRSGDVLGQATVEVPTGGAPVELTVDCP